MLARGIGSSFCTRDVAEGAVRDVLDGFVAQAGHGADRT